MDNQNIHLKRRLYEKVSVFAPKKFSEYTYVTVIASVMRILADPDQYGIELKSKYGEMPISLPRLRKLIETILFIYVEESNNLRYSYLSISDAITDMMTILDNVGVEVVDIRAKDE